MQLSIIYLVLDAPQIHHVQEYSSTPCHEPRPPALQIRTYLLPLLNAILDECLTIHPIAVRNLEIALVAFPWYNLWLYTITSTSLSFHVPEHFSFLFLILFLILTSLSLWCRAQALHCSALDFSSCSTRGLVFEAHRLSCPTAGGILVPNQDQIPFPCNGRQILNHKINRQVPLSPSYYPHCYLTLTIIIVS